ncbi:MAG: MMPL family transporter, partial [Kofleriaceae bacterium]
RELRERLTQSSYVSGDVQRVMVRIAFDRTDTKRAARLMREVDRLRAGVEAVSPGVRIGVAGGVSVSVVEHDALVRGMTLSGVVTAVLVGLVLVGFLRSLRLVVMAGVTLAVSTTIAFGVAAITVGQLNIATAFLGAIIAGNGINYGILLLARYQEERAREPAVAALASAIHATVRPTLVASLAASVAYGSLALTSFRGFADFALIGGVGMLVCWIGAFVLLPILIVGFDRSSKPPERTPLVGTMLARLFGFRRPALALALAAAVAAASTVIVVRFVADDPLEYDLRRLRSDGAAAHEARRWMTVADQAFGPGLINRSVIAVDDAANVPLLVETLRTLEAGVPAPDRLIGEVRSILDVVPADQAERRAVLDELRDLIDHPLLAHLDDAMLAELRELRPPDGLGEIRPRGLPEELAAPLTELDGSIGRLIAVRPGPGFDEWDGRSSIQFATTLRRVLAVVDDGVAISGSTVIFADLIDVIRRDGPRVTLFAVIGLLLLVPLIVGRDGRALAALAATGLGAVAMVATCALLGIKVNFLDFVALPITLGLGVDYAINLAHRQHVDGGDPLGPLRTSGAAVLVCSLTTVIGYGSLLASQNLAIRDFGLAALIGEITCLLAACVVVPAMLTRRSPRNAHS